MKDWCEGSRGVNYDERPYAAGSGANKLAKCRKCSRVLKPGARDGKLSWHQVRGPTTRSMDTTMDRLWAYAGEHVWGRDVVDS